MFTFGDIRNIAIQIERNGEKTYRNASKAAKEPHIAETFAWMAEEEQRHAEWFADLRSTKPLTADQLEMEAIGRTLLQDMIKGNDFLLDQKDLEKVENTKEVLAIAKTFEEDTILFYQFILGFLEDQETSRQLEIIIDEERRHIQQIELMEERNSRESSESLSC